MIAGVGIIKLIRDYKKPKEHIIQSKQLQINNPPLIQGDIFYKEF